MRAPRSTSPRVAFLLLALLVGCDRLSDLAPKKRATRESDSSESEETPKKKAKKKTTAEVPATADPTPAPDLTFTSAPLPAPDSSVKLEFERVAPIERPGPKVDPAYDFTKLAATKILPKLREEKLPSLRATQIVVYPERVAVTLHDQPTLRDVRSVVLQGDSVSNKGNAPPFIRATAQQLAEREFDAASIDWPGLPKIVEDALRRANGRRTSHVVIERPLPFDREIQIRVFLTDVDEASKYIDYDAKGRFKRGG